MPSSKSIKRVNFNITGGDVLSFSDSLSILKTDIQRKISVSDFLSFLDNIHIISGSNVQITFSDDFLLLDDSFITFLTELENVDPGDSLILTDTISFLIQFFLSISDTLTFTDALSLLRLNSTNFVDSYSLTDSVSLALLNTSQDQSLHDSLSMSDEVNVLVGISDLNPYLRRYLNDNANS